MYCTKTFDFRKLCNSLPVTRCKFFIVGVQICFSTTNGYFKKIHILKFLPKKKWKNAPLFFFFLQYLILTSNMTKICQPMILFYVRKFLGEIISKAIIFDLKREREREKQIFSWESFRYLNNYSYPKIIFDKYHEKK